jgi:hypothetical protein
VGIVAINISKKVEAGRNTEVAVSIKNYSNSTQTRNVQLFVNDAPAGPGQLITLGPGKDGSVKYEVRFNNGTATLSANLFPGDSNPANDNGTRTVMVGQNNDHDDDDDRGRGGRDR